ncbi:hypothetical protein EASAB2608_03493 [Streptomyces sp. EAS-AB2608]|uniref:Transposase n=1 Tax=Streptomyces bangladeshensis TaxID=295352 RepID=A0ABN3BD79_9ACTN|nr:hypothetical protein EASAB2608_03493 [Streptomyces sp. EAS-AB2608]
MGDDLDGVLWCVGHRVMVPPSSGTWCAVPGVRGGAGASAGRTRVYTLLDYKTFVRKILYKPYKEDRRTHSHRLWCSDGPWEKLDGRPVRPTTTGVDRGEDL